MSSLLFLKNTLLLLIFGLFVSASTPEASLLIDNKETNNKDVTSRVEVLGNPFSKSAYARNVWDMQVFDGKIYLGHGNSSNDGPSPNAGPIPIYYYNPTTNKFETQDVVSSSAKKTGTKKYVDEEQIDTFKVLNGKLYIPGNDAHGEGWEFGNYYKLDNGKWIKYRNIPNGIHVYDMAYFNGNLYAAIGTDTSPDVLMSQDDGITWSKIGSVDKFGPTRAYTLFEFKKKLYAVSALLPKNNNWSDETKILCIQGCASEGIAKQETRQTTVFGSEMLPGISKNATKVPPYVRMVRTTVIDNKLLYIAGEIVNDQHWIPQSLFVATDINDARSVAFPNPKALPMDLLVRGDTVFALAYVETSPGQYTNIVYKANSSDLVNWTELFSFKQNTFARSFEELNGDFYFGMGSNDNNPSELTGTILRVKKK
ncbi:hypothetical protein ACFQZT_27410 [Paenibacillus sp. GCM10027628]|uniref:hypothetical protein n=1 Tax=Paenibacillus sp. GCM10027628 TaxID=3273413 RepID=UPI003632EF05